MWTNHPDQRPGRRNILDMLENTSGAYAFLALLTKDGRVTFEESSGVGAASGTASKKEDDATSEAASGLETAAGAALFMISSTTDACVKRVTPSEVFTSLC